MIPGGEAIAQTEAADGRVVYRAGFFADFLPTNANDMVQKLPGFTFNKGDEVRGFAGAAGNVLIDGVRPTSKSVPLDQLLQRIPAKSVDRIELIRGGAPGIDMQGQSVLANVMRFPTGEAVTAVQTLIKPYMDGDTALVGRIEQSWRRGPLALEGAVQVRKDKHTDTGAGRMTRVGPGVNEAGAFDADVHQDFYQANGAAEYRLPNNDLLHVTLGGERSDTNRDERGYPVELSTRQGFFERTRVKLRNDKGEVGADYRHAFNTWLTGQVIGLQTVKRDAQRSQLDGRNTPQTAFEQGDTSESIGRVVLSSSRWASLRLEGGMEGALNSLDSTSTLSKGGLAVAVPSANVRVQETRGEIFATANLKPADKLSLELGARMEASTIDQTGGANQSKSLSFFKPRAILAFEPDGQSQIRARIERTVGQLNFKEFAASSSLEAGTVNAGNPDLEPERAWVVEAAFERRFWGRGAAVLTLAHYEVEHVADLVPINGFDAPGNIGNGRREELKFSLTLPLDKLRLSGAQFRFNGTWRWSEVTDPVTNKGRVISGQRPFEGDFLLSKQFPSMKSSINLEGVFGYSETFFRLAEIRQNVDQPLLKIYWDWMPRPDLQFRFQVENISAKDKERFRTLYTGSRAVPQTPVYEARYAEFKPFLVWRMRKSF